MHMLVHVRTLYVVCHGITNTGPVHCSRPFDEGERLEHTPNAIPNAHELCTAELKCDRSPNLQCLVTLAHAVSAPPSRPCLKDEWNQRNWLCLQRSG
jgi:hypothetical protein